MGFDLPIQSRAKKKLIPDVQDLGFGPTDTVQPPAAPPPTVGRGAVPRPAPTQEQDPLWRRMIGGTEGYTQLPYEPTVREPWAGYSPRVQESIRAAGLVDTSADRERRRQEVERVVSFAKELESPYNQTNFVENLEREAQGLSPRMTGGSFEHYDATISGVAYELIHKSQTLIPGEQELETRVKEMTGFAGIYDEEGFEREFVINPNTGKRESRIISPNRHMRIAEEEKILPWYVVEPVKLAIEILLDPMEAIPGGLARAAVRAASGGLVKVGGAGVRRLPGTTLFRAPRTAGEKLDPFFSGPWMQKVPEAAAARGRRATSGEGIIPGFQPGVIRGGGVAEIISPDNVMVKPPVLGGKHFGIKPAVAGLTPSEKIARFVQVTAGAPFRNVIPEDSYGTSVGRLRSDSMLQVRRVAAAESRALSYRVESNFDMNEFGQIKSLASMTEDFPEQESWMRRIKRSTDEDIIGFAPTIQDLAARLPRYWDELTIEQRKVMGELREYSQRYDEILEDAEMPVTTVRSDIQLESGNTQVPSGFYMHRGDATLVREAPKIGPVRIHPMFRPEKKVSLGSAYRGQVSHRKFDKIASMSEGIQGVVDSDGAIKQYRYPHIREALRSYSEQVGQDIVDAHSANFLSSLIDPDTGLLMGSRLSDQISKPIRQQWNSLNRRVQSTRNSLKSLYGKSPVLDAELKRIQVQLDRQTARSASRLGEAGARLGRADRNLLMRDRTLLPDEWEIKEVISAWEGALKTAQDARDFISSHIGPFRSERRLASKKELKLARSLQKVDRLIVDVSNLAGNDNIHLWRNVLEQVATNDPARTVGNTTADVLSRKMQEIDELSSLTDDLLEEVEFMAKRVEDMEGEIYGSRMAQEAAKFEARSHRNALKAQIRRQHMVGKLERDISLLRLEERRITKILNRELTLSGKQLSDAEIRVMKNELSKAKLADTLMEREKELAEFKGVWKSSVQGSAKPPEGNSIIPLPGLGGYYWPDAMANAARKYIQREPGIAGPDPKAFYDRFNSLYRGARATLDNSLMFVQMLLRFYDNPKAWQRVARFTWQLWGVPGSQKVGIVGGRGESAADAFFYHFDAKTAELGHLTSSQWAANGLIINGSDTEFAFGRGFGIGQLPGVKQANRAFGVGGDMARLEWADDYLEGMLKNHTLEELGQRGDLEKIANAINGATGWSKGRTGGDLGDLLLFAPRFLQSRFDTLARAIMGTPSVVTGWRGPYGPQRGGPLGKLTTASLEKRMAAKSMIKMISIGTSLTFGANYAMGNETDHRPVVKVMEGTKGEHWVKNPNFMRILTPWGTNISLFGTWDSLVGMMITSALVTEGGGPHKAMRSMSSGTVANIWDFWTGSDAMGNPVGSRGESADWMKVMARLAENFVPFIEDQVDEGAKGIVKDLSDNDIASAVGRSIELIGFEAHGGKSSPMSLAEQRNEQRQYRGQRLLSTGGFDYREIHVPGQREPDVIKRSDTEIDLIEEVLNEGTWTFNPYKLPADVLRFIDDDPTIQRLTEEREDRQRERGDEFRSYADDKDVLKEARTDALEQAWEEAGRKPNRVYRRAVSQIYKEYATKVQSLENEYESLMASLERTSPPEAALGRAIDDFMKVMENPALDDGLGRRDFDEQERMLAELEDRWAADTDYGPDMMAQVRFEIGRNATEGEKQLRQNREVLRPLWHQADLVEESFYRDPDYTDQEKGILARFIQAKSKDSLHLQSIWRGLASQSGSDIITSYEGRVTAIREWMRTPDQPPGFPVYEDAAETDRAYIDNEIGSSAKSGEGIDAKWEAIVNQLNQ